MLVLAITFSLFWQENKMRFPRFIQMHMKKHPAPATSISLERAFGFAGLSQMSEETGMKKIANFRIHASCMVQL